MKKLENKVAVITGGSTGIGRQTAKRFVDEGAHVVVMGRTQKDLDETVKYVGKNVLTVQGDVSKLSDLDKLYQVVQEVHGRVDIVFANAGIANFASLDEVTESHYDSHFDINVKGLFFTVQKALPLLSKGGVIILTSSIAANIGQARLSVYSATKAAVRSFARVWSLDLKDRGIRVNSISPGPIETPIFDKLGLTQDQFKDFKQQTLTDCPLGRIGTPDELAKAVVFLASDDSSYVTGIDLCVDGGLAQV